MKERPILFSGPMVRAILAGQKTQTRRTKGLEYFSRHENDPDGWRCVRVVDGIAYMVYKHTPHEREVKCPLGRPADRLYVRETWAQPMTLDPGPTIYRADYPACVPSYYTNVPLVDEVVWKPSIHMPKSASRITLEITGVRVERLQDISEADAVAEGIQISSQARRSDACYGIYECLMPDGKTHFNDSAYELYRRLWDQINGPESWVENPWVWVVNFQRIK